MLYQSRHTNNHSTNTIRMYKNTSSKISQYLSIVMSRKVQVFLPISSWFPDLVTNRTNNIINNTIIRSVLANLFQSYTLNCNVLSQSPLHNFCIVISNSLQLHKRGFPIEKMSNFLYAYYIHVVCITVTIN